MSKQKPSERIEELRNKEDWKGNSDLQYVVEILRATILYLDELHSEEEKKQPGEDMVTIHADRINLSCIEVNGSEYLSREEVLRVIEEMKKTCYHSYKLLDGIGECYNTALEDLKAKIARL